MQGPSNRKVRVATMLFALWLVFSPGLNAQKGMNASKTSKPISKPISKPASKPAAPVPASAPARAVGPGSSIGLKVSGDWKVEADHDEDASKTLGGLLAKGKPAMLFFVSARDPATLANAERIKKLEDDYAKKSVTVIAVGVGRGETYETLKAVAERSDWDFPVVQDVNQNISRGLRAGFTPEVMLIDSGGAVRYAGPIDDSWLDARKAKTPYVRNALDALLAGKKISNPEPDAGYLGAAIR